MPLPHPSPGARLAALLLLLAGPAVAATVNGSVRDADSGQPLPLTVVAFPDLQRGAVADDDGYWAVRGVPPGRHALTVSRIGHRTWSDTVAVDSADVRFDVRLPGAVIDLEETVVTADATARAERERRVQSGFVALAAPQLAQLPAVGESDLLRSLQLLPGVQAASDVSSGLYVRGGGPDQTLVLYDDVPLYNPAHAFGFFSTFQPEVVRDVQLYKGAYPAVYGGSLGAVLDVHPHEAVRDSVRVTGGVSLIAARLLAEGPAGPGSWMVAARRTYLDPVLAALRAGGTDVPAYYFYDLNARWTQPLSAADQLTVGAYAGNDDLDFDVEAGTFFQVRWGNRAAHVRWTHLFTPALLGEVTLSTSRYVSATSASFFETPVRLDNRVEDLTLRGDVEFFADSDHTLTAGVRATRYDVRFVQVFNQAPQLGLAATPTLWEGYVQDEARLPTGTQVRAGLRLARFSAGGGTAWMPRLSLSQPLTDRWRWKGAIGSYRQHLQLVSTEGFSGGDFWVPLDDSVPPTRSRQATTGLEWEPGRRYLVTAEVYRSDMQGLVALDNDAPLDRPVASADDVFVAGGDGTATGLEVFAQKRTGRLRGWVGYTLGRTRRTFAEIDAGRPFPPKYDRRHDLAVVGSYRLGVWRLGASLVYATGQAYTPATARYTLRDPATGVPEDRVLAGPRHSARLLPYHRMDVSARRQLTLFGAAAEVYLQVFNLYSRRNEWFVQYDTQDPRTQPEVVLQLPVVPTFGLEFSF